jgi:hypothetical protein
VEGVGGAAGEGGGGVAALLEDEPNKDVRLPRKEGRRLNIKEEDGG